MVIHINTTRHAQVSSKYSLGENNTIFATLTTNNREHKTVGKRNCNSNEKRQKISSRQYTNIHLRNTKTATADTISTLNVNNYRIPTHVMHIKKTFMKHDSNNDNPKHKSIEAPTAGSVSSVMVVIFLVFLFVALRRHTKKREISKSKDRTTKSSSKNRSREGSNSSKGYNYMPLYSSVNNLTKNKLSETIPQSQSITNVGYMDASDFGVQNEDYDHIERDVRREDVDIVYSLTTYQKSEDDYEMSGNFNESLRSYQENYIYD